MGTRSELDYWGAAHRELGKRLRRTGRCVEVVAMAWEQKHLDRARRRLEFWAAGDRSGGEQKAVFLRQALADADWDTVERHGGFDAVVEKINQSEQKRPPSNGAGMIDNFRLRGSRRCRPMGETATT